MKALTYAAALAIAAVPTLLSGCGADSSPTDNPNSTFSAPRSTGDSTGDAAASAVTGPGHFVGRVPDACSLLTEAVARNLLKVAAVVAHPTNSGPDSANPRCSYRDAEAQGKSVSIVVVRTPYAVLNSTMPADEVRALADQHYGQQDAAYQAIDFGPGPQRFVAVTKDRVTMFVMSGIGAPGGSYDPNVINAEAAFAVTLRDPARTADQRLTEARNLAVAYQSNLINSARPR